MHLDAGVVAVNLSVGDRENADERERSGQPKARLQKRTHNSPNASWAMQCYAVLSFVQRLYYGRLRGRGMTCDCKAALVFQDHVRITQCGGYGNGNARRHAMLC
eukprot:1034710-Pyramimonas_sp.AAC.2